MRERNRQRKRTEDEYNVGSIGVALSRTRKAVPTPMRHSPRDNESKPITDRLWLAVRRGRRERGIGVDKPLKGNITNIKMLKVQGEKQYARCQWKKKATLTKAIANCANKGMITNPDMHVAERMSLEAEGDLGKVGKWAPKSARSMRGARLSQREREIDAMAMGIQDMVD